MESKLYLPGVSYFEQNNFVSNSTLGAFWDWLNGKPKMDLQAAYNFGNLLDGLMTEPGLIDMEKMSCRLAYGEVVHFTKDVFDKAQKMRRDALEDPTMQLVFNNMNFQYEKYVDEFEIDTPDAYILLPIRIKMDGNNERISTGMDLKSTQCMTDKSFRDSLNHFNYDRQCALYMDVSGVNRFWFLGVGKKPLKTGRHPIFRFCVERGDPFYLAGKAKYESLAIMYHNLVYSLNPDLI